MFHLAMAGYSIDMKAFLFDNFMDMRSMRARKNVDSIPPYFREEEK